jgi:thiazolylpeptide-type bacteriocin precursor
MNNEKLLKEENKPVEIDVDSLEIGDFLKETQLSSAEEVSNVMAASCTTCECCCSVS